MAQKREREREPEGGDSRGRRGRDNGELLREPEENPWMDSHVGSSRGSRPTCEYVGGT
jgi:hypothetical protein